MIDGPVLRDPERSVALSYVRADLRPAFNALWVLDETLADILRSTRDPLIGQMRLTWWHGALCALDTAAAPDQPVLAAIVGQILPTGIGGPTIATMIDGWETLLETDPLGDENLINHADMRGVPLFALGARIAGMHPDDRVAEAGRGWALVDLGIHLSDPAARGRCFALAIPRLEGAMATAWPHALRPLGMLAWLALIDARAGDWPVRRQGSPSRLMRMMWHAISGR